MLRSDAGRAGRAQAYRKLSRKYHPDKGGSEADFQALEGSPIGEKLLIGKSVTRGLSTGGDVEIGQTAAEKDENKLRQMVDGQDLIFIVAGLGGGTGSGAGGVLLELGLDEAHVLPLDAPELRLPPGHLAQHVRHLGAPRELGDACLGQHLGPVRAAPQLVGVEAVRRGEVAPPARPTPTR